MPQLGEAVAEATIDRWLKRTGDEVRRYEPLLEVTTAKVTTEIPSPADGVLEEILAGEGETVAVGAPIARLGATAADGDAAAASSVPEPQGLFPSSPPPTAAPPAPSDAPAPFSPAVRRLATEYAVNLRDVRGTGSGGRVTREDVMAHAHRQRLETADVTKAPASDEVVVPSALRRTIAQRMLESTQGIPHAWMMVEVDVTGLVRLRKGVRAEFQRRDGFDLTYFPFFIKAVVEGLRAEPVLNASWTEAGIVYHHAIHLGVAVATEEGLVVPVLRAADGMSVAGIARAVRDLAARTRAGDLGPEDMRGATFTVNNTGALGSVVSMPIINPPESGIITLETIRARPAVVSEGIAIRDMVNVSFSFDHRVADGLTAGRFMQHVRRVLEAFGPGDPVY